MGGVQAEDWLHAAPLLGCSCNGTPNQHPDALQQRV